MKAHLILSLLFLAGGGCASSKYGARSESARAVASGYVGTKGQVAGPFPRRNTTELGALSSEDRREAESLLAHGALAFAVFVPDYSIIFTMKNGKSPDMIKLGRVVMVEGDRVVGDFSVR